MKNQLYTQVLEKDKKKKFIYLIGFLLVLVVIVVTLFAFGSNMSDIFSFHRNEKDDSVTQNKPAKNEPNAISTISIIVADVGLNHSILEELGNLPKEVGFAINPYSDQVTKIVANSKAAGRDTFICIPMQPYNYHYNDPGPYALLDNLSDAENQNRLKMILSLASGVTGMHFDHMEVFTTSAENLDAILPTIEESKLPIVYYDPDGAKRLIGDINKGHMHINTLKIDIILDNELEGQAIRNSFDKLIKRTKLYGDAVGIIRPYPISIDILKEYLLKFSDSHVEIISPSDALVRQGKIDRAETAAETTKNK